MDLEVERELRRMRRRRQIILLGSALCTLICLILFFCYTYQKERKDKEIKAMSTLIQNSEERPSSDAENVINPVIVTPNVSLGEQIAQPEILNQYKSLYDMNKKLIGWLKIDDTIIDYPVMQTENNEYYLNHNSNQEEDHNGSLFLDAECSIYPRSDNLIIYGHHMKSGSMFGDLDLYENESFYLEHPSFCFDTIYEEGIYDVMYVFRSRIFSEEEICFKYYQFIDAASEEEFNSNMNEMSWLSLYHTGVTAAYGDSILTLSTCDYSEKDARFVVVAKKR